MCGTAAEVTPVRAVDDHVIGVGPVTLELQKAYLETVNGTRRALGALARVVASPRARGVKLGRVAADPALDALISTSARKSSSLEVLRSGRLSLGPTIDRFEELFAEAVGAPYAAAVSSGTAGLHLLCRHRRDHCRRRGDHVAVLVRRLRELRDLRGRDARVRRHRLADAEPRPGGGRGRDHRAHARRSSRSTSSATRASWTSCTRSASRHGLVLIEDACEALGAHYKGAPIGSHGPPRGVRLLPEQADHDGRGRDGHDSLRGGVAAPASRSATRAAPTAAAGSNTRGSGSTTGSTTSRAAIGIGAAREARRDPRGARAPSRRATGSCSAGSRPRASARGRRRPHALVVRLRRRAARPDRPRAVIAELEAQGSQTARYLRASTCSRTCASATASGEGLCPVAEDVERTHRSRCRSTPGSRTSAQDHVAEALAAPL